MLVEINSARLVLNRMAVRARWCNVFRYLHLLMPLLTVTVLIKGLPMAIPWGHCLIWPPSISKHGYVWWLLNVVRVIWLHSWGFCQYEWTAYQYYSSESVHGYNNHDNWHANLHTSFTYLSCYIMVGNRYTLLISSLVMPFGKSSHKTEDVWYILLVVKKPYDFPGHWF